MALVSSTDSERSIDGRIADLRANLETWRTSALPQIDTELGKATQQVNFDRSVDAEAARVLRRAEADANRPGASREDRREAAEARSARELAAGALQASHRQRLRIDVRRSNQLAAIARAEQLIAQAERDRERARRAAAAQAPAQAAARGLLARLRATVAGRGA